jgi:hypothetical protein
MSKRSEQLAAMRHVADTAKSLLGGTVDIEALRQAVAFWDAFNPLPFRRRQIALSQDGGRGGCVDSSLLVPGTSTNGEISKLTTTPRDSAKSVSAKGPPTWLSVFASEWRKRFDASPHWGQLARALGPLVAERGEEKVLAHWKNYLLGTGAQYASAARFAATFGAWTTADPDAWKHDLTAFRPGETIDAYIMRHGARGGR